MQCLPSDMLPTCVATHLCAGFTERLAVYKRRLFCAICLMSLWPVCWSCRCVQCATNQPYSLDCESCLLQPDAGRVRRCYDCVAAANTSAAGCSDCLDDNLDAAVVQECIACLANNETAGKRWCVGCSNWYKDDAFHRERCYACLKEDKNDTMDYMHACSKVQWQDVLLPYRRLP